jgi:hypothetical protein
VTTLEQFQFVSRMPYLKRHIRDEDYCVDLWFALLLLQAEHVNIVLADTVLGM